MIKHYEKGILTMDHTTIYKNLIKEALSGKQFKRLPALIRIFAFLVCWPFMVLGAVCYISYAVYNFIFQLFSNGSIFLEEWVKKMKQEVSGLTEAVLYFFTVPILFFAQIVLSLFSAIFFLHFF